MQKKIEFAALGGNQVLLLPDVPLRASRPTWLNYVMSININKPMNELELNMIAYTLKSRTNRPIRIKVQSALDGQVKTIDD